MNIIRTHKVKHMSGGITLAPTVTGGNVSERQRGLKHVAALTTEPVKADSMADTNLPHAVPLAKSVKFLRCEIERMLADEAVRRNPGYRAGDVWFSYDPVGRTLTSVRVELTPIPAATRPSLEGRVGVGT